MEGWLCMKNFLRVFVIALVLFLIALYAGSYSFVKENDLVVEEELAPIVEKEDLTNIIIKTIEVEKKEPEIYSSLEEAFEKSNRINFLMVGLEDVRSDTIILASFCPDSKKLNLINIPRDTYLHRKGYNRAEQRKINSVFGEHGIAGLQKSVSHILNEMPIDHYVIMEYEGVKNIVDAIGGVEVDIPINMKYTDPYSNPPLKIDLKKGIQTLDGDKALQFLRFRKGNNGKVGYAEGDLGRIKAQQQFVTSFINKSSDNILTVITNGFKYIETDVSLIDAMSYGRKALGITKEDIETITLPGEAEFRNINRKVLSYYIEDKDEITTILEKIYNVKRDSI